MQGRATVGLLPALMVIMYCGVGCPTAGLAAEPYTAHTFRLADGEAPPAASRSDVAWFVGAWEGDCFDVRCEEVWNPPDDLEICIALTRDGDVREHRLTYRRGFAAHAAK